MTETGIVPCKILLPNTEDYSSWACIACDQFTGDRGYWEELALKVKGKRTALDLILPEVYLGDGAKERIKKTNRNISEYIKAGAFRELPEGFVLTVRETPYVKRRIGLIGAVDLEKYEYAQKSDALIRSTEGTIEERIPPRLKIRENAEAEFSHIMVLFDDEKRKINETLYAKRDTFEKLYDFELNMGGGRLEGYYIKGGEAVAEAFGELIAPERLIKKYGKNDKFAFAVGDGNHSLATAKAHWNNVKKTLSDSEKANHPARFALAEFVNIYDDGIYFEPIFRYVSNVDVEKFVNGFKKAVCGKTKVYAGGVLSEYGAAGDIPQIISATDAYIKNYVAENGGEVDYIHGENELRALVDANKNSVGILFDKINKSDLFAYVSEKGSLPRKTFSMGEGVEKRYYLEGRKIK